MLKSFGALLLCVLLTCLSTNAYAQSDPVHPTDSNATYLGSLAVNLTIPTTLLTRPLITSSSGTNINVTVTVWRTNGRTDYSYNASDITFGGDCSGLDSMSTRAIFNLVSQTVVAQGVLAGNSPCPALCTNADTVTVTTASCVQRTGSGSSTDFNICTPNAYCVRQYAVCCPNGLGSPLITLVGSWSAGCIGMPPTTSCEETCP